MSFLVLKVKVVSLKSKIFHCQCEDYWIWALCAAAHQSVCVTWPGSLPLGSCEERFTGGLATVAMETEALPSNTCEALRYLWRRARMSEVHRTSERERERERETKSILSDSDSSDWGAENTVRFLDSSATRAEIKTFINIIWRLVFCSDLNQKGSTAPLQELHLFQHNRGDAEPSGRCFDVLSQDRRLVNDFSHKKGQESCISQINLSAVCNK